MKQTHEIILRPANLFAFTRVFPLILLALIFLLLAWWLSPVFILLSLPVSVTAWYRFLLARARRYFIGTEYIRIRSGIFFKRTVEVELYRVKDYTITRPLLHQLCRIMDLTLKTTDPGNPVIFFGGIPESDIIGTIRDRVGEARRHNNA